jgi:cytochrome b6-f complex iron-sulfur subunit
MSATAIILIAVVAVVILGAIAFLSLARKSDVRGAGALSAETVQRDRASRVADQKTSAAAQAEAAGVEARSSTTVATVAEKAPVAWSPPDPEAIGVSRRQFLNRATIALMTAGLGTFAAASFLAFLWPSATGGFGGRVPVGRLEEILREVRNGSGFFYASEARTWITAYPADALPKAELVYDASLMPGMRAGLIASYQKCPHLGCRVPECLSSQWFECGCHGSQYSRVGEHKGGPAPRGMDHFAIDVTPAGDVIVDTGSVVQGTPLGTNTTGQEAEGPNCVGEVDH